MCLEPAQLVQNQVLFVFWLREREKPFMMLWEKEEEEEEEEEEDEEGEEEKEEAKRMSKMSNV